MGSSVRKSSMGEVSTALWLPERSMKECRARVHWLPEGNHKNTFDHVKTVRPFGELLGVPPLEGLEP